MLPTVIYFYKGHESNRIQVPAAEVTLYYMERPSRNQRIELHPTMPTFVIIAQDPHTLGFRLRKQYRNENMILCRPGRPLSREEVVQCVGRVCGDCEIHWRDPTEPLFALERTEKEVDSKITTAIAKTPHHVPPTLPILRARRECIQMPKSLTVTNDGGGLGDQVGVWLATQMFRRAGVHAVPDYGTFKPFFADATPVAVPKYAVHPKPQYGNDTSVPEVCIGSICFPWVRSGLVPTTLYYSQLYRTNDYFRRYLMIELSGMHKLEYFAHSFGLDTNLESFFAFKQPKGDKIVVHAGAGHQGRVWPNLDERALRKVFGKRIVIVKGKLDLVQFKELASKTALFVGTDSGVYNYLTYLGVKNSIMLSGPSREITAWPWSKILSKSSCTPCWWRDYQGCSSYKCMKAITTPDVIAAVKERL